MTPARTVRPSRVAITALAIAVASFLAWYALSWVDPGEKWWNAWNGAIDILWIVIPVSLLVGVLTAIIALLAPRNVGERSRTFGAILLVLEVLVSAFLLLIFLNLRIG